MPNQEFNTVSNYSITSLFFYSEMKKQSYYERGRIHSTYGEQIGSFYDVSSFLGINDFSFGGYKPRTELGKKLLEIRRRFILKGGKLLSPEEIDREIKLRRGGVSAGGENIP